MVTISPVVRDVCTLCVCRCVFHFGVHVYLSLMLLTCCHACSLKIWSYIYPSRLPARFLRISLMSCLLCCFRSSREFAYVLLLIVPHYVTHHLLVINFSLMYHPLCMHTALPWLSCTTSSQYLHVLVYVPCCLCFFSPSLQLGVLSVVIRACCGAAVYLL